MAKVQVDPKIDQTDEQMKLVDKIKKMYRRSYDTKGDLHRTWDDCMKAYTGEYFKQNMPDYKSQEISNYVFSTVETIKPIMLSENPKTLALPSNQALQQKADVVQKALDYEWQRTHMFLELTKALTHYLTYGTMICALLWDSTSQRGLGDVKPIFVSPFNIFPDTMATSVEDAEYIIYACYKNVGQVIQSYPDKEEELKSNIETPSDTYLSYGKSLDDTSRNQILYLECYMRDYSTEIEESEQDGQIVKTTKAKYPNGRRVIIAGDTLLDDSENPYQDGKFPFVMCKCYDIPGQFFGMGDVEQIISPLKSALDLTNSMLESAGLMSNPIWILDKNSGVEKNSLTNRKGLVVRKNPGTEVKREAPPPLPAYIENIIDVLKKDIEQISGVYDVTRGERPTGITAAAAITALNEQAQGRIKLKVQMLEQMLGQLGGMWLSRLQQFWVTKRTIRVMGANYQPSFYDVSGDEIDGDFDISVVAGSTLPVNKTAKLQQLVQLAQTQGEDGLPMVDRQTILENSDLQDVQNILARFDQLHQMQQQAQQQQAQMQNQANNKPSVPSESISFKDLPPEGKVQMAQQVGIQLTPDDILQHEAMMQQTQMLHATHQANLSSRQQMQQAQNQQDSQNRQMEHQKQMQDSKNNIETKEQVQEPASKENKAPDMMQDTQQQTPQGQSTVDPMQNIIETLSKLPPEEVRKLAKENPQIAQILQMLSNNQ